MKFRIISLLFFVALNIAIVKPIYASPACNRNDYVYEAAYTPVGNPPICLDTFDSSGNKVPDCYDGSSQTCWPIKYADYTAECDGSNGYMDMTSPQAVSPASVGVSIGPIAEVKICKFVFQDLCCKKQDRSDPADRLKYLTEWCIPTGHHISELNGKINNYADCGLIINMIGAANIQDKKSCKPGMYYRPSSKTCVSPASSGWQSKTESCVSSSTASKGVATAIGCIPTNSLESTASFLFKWAFGIAGGIILLIALGGAYSLMTSSGDQQKLQQVKETFSSIIAGLLLMLFSLILLKVVGANIINIQGLF